MALLIDAEAVAVVSVAVPQVAGERFGAGFQPDVHVGVHGIELGLRVVRVGDLVPDFECGRGAPYDPLHLRLLREAGVVAQPHDLHEGFAPRLARLGVFFPGGHRFERFVHDFGVPVLVLAVILRGHAERCGLRGVPRLRDEHGEDQTSLVVRARLDPQLGRDFDFGAGQGPFGLADVVEVEAGDDEQRQRRGERAEKQLMFRDSFHGRKVLEALEFVFVGQQAAVQPELGGESVLFEGGSRCPNP